ncbi:hypothetical protein EDC96DRAFT_158645 [Choanephora cucurbitarum]|nr:hypothetical protein EDC96DRAFT_158645 [Choanephora cucurbitarum]
MNDTIMKEATAKKERSRQYNVYTLEDRKWYLYYFKEKLMKPREAAQAANANYVTACKWKKIYEEDPDRAIPTKRDKSWSS